MSIQLRSVKVVLDRQPSDPNSVRNAGNDETKLSVGDVSDAVPDTHDSITGYDVKVDLGCVNEGFSKDESLQLTKIDDNFSLKNPDPSGSLLAEEENRSGSGSDDGATSRGCWDRNITRIQAATSQFFNSYGKTIRRTFYGLLLVGYGAYFAWSLFYEFGTESSVRLLWMTMVAVGLVVITMIRDNCGDWIVEHIIAPPVGFISRHFTVFKW